MRSHVAACVCHSHCVPLVVPNEAPRDGYSGLGLVLVDIFQTFHSASLVAVAVGRSHISSCQAVTVRFYLAN